MYVYIPMEFLAVSLDLGMSLDHLESASKIKLFLENGCPLCPNGKHLSPGWFVVKMKMRSSPELGPETVRKVEDATKGEGGRPFSIVSPASLWPSHPAYRAQTVIASSICPSLLPVFNLPLLQGPGHMTIQIHIRLPFEPWACYQKSAACVNMVGMETDWVITKLQTA